MKYIEDEHTAFVISQMDTNFFSLNNMEMLQFLQLFKNLFHFFFFTIILKFLRNSHAAYFLKLLTTSHGLVQLIRRLRRWKDGRQRKKKLKWHSAYVLYGFWSWIKMCIAWRTPTSECGPHCEVVVVHFKQVLRLCFARLGYIWWLFCQGAGRRWHFQRPVEWKTWAFKELKRTTQTLENTDSIWDNANVFYNWWHQNCVWETHEAQLVVVQMVVELFRPHSVLSHSSGWTDIGSVY